MRRDVLLHVRISVPITVEDEQKHDPPVSVISSEVEKSLTVWPQVSILAKA